MTEGTRALKGYYTVLIYTKYKIAVNCYCVLAAPLQDNLDAFKNGDVRFLICTDVAARGVDIKGLPYVVNMTLPDEPENYIHRIGRVGRQDCLGLAVSIVACDGCREKVIALSPQICLYLAHRTGAPRLYFNG